MSLQQYATLDQTQAFIISIDTWDTTVVAALQAASNPKYTFLRIVNMTTQPGFNPATQCVVQNGWTISPSDIEPVWVVQALTAGQIATNNAIAAWNAQLSANLVTAFQNYIAIAVPTQAQTTAVVLQLVKCIQALLEAKYGDMT